MSKMVLVLLLCIMFSACENPLSKDKPAPTPVPVITPMDITESDLVGTWQTACTYDSANGLSEQSTIVYTLTTAVGTSILYTGSSCSTAILTQVSTVDYTLGNHAQGDPGAYDADWTTSSTLLTSNHEDITDEFNNQSFCGMSNWSTSTVKNITGLTCGSATLSSNGDVIFDIILVATPGNVLYMTEASPDSSNTRDQLTRASLVTKFYKQ